MWPDQTQIDSALDATWPAARLFDDGPWRLREGQGGGQRVSAATAISPVLETEIAHAETEMRAMSQRPLFMIRPGEDALDGWLADRAYDIVDPVTVYACAPGEIAGQVPPATAIQAWPPLTVQHDLWEAGGVGPARVAVMERAATPKTALLSRSDDTPSGVAFMAIHEGIAMLHALEVSKAMRRSGVATFLMRAAANWAIRKGASLLAVLVTKANGPANALYQKLSMIPISSYRYRRAPEALA